jgi:hypothetical protein
MKPFKATALCLAAVATLTACPGPKSQQAQADDVESGGALGGPNGKKGSTRWQADAGVVGEDVALKDLGTTVVSADAVAQDDATPPPEDAATVTPDVGNGTVDAKLVLDILPTLVLDSGTVTVGADVVATEPDAYVAPIDVYVAAVDVYVAPVDAYTPPPDAYVAPKDVVVAPVDTGPDIHDTAVAPVDTYVAPKDIVTAVDTGPATTPDAGSQPPPPSGKVYGLTVDSVWGNVPDIVAALKTLPVKPWVRIVFDYPLQASDYYPAVSEIAPYAVIVGQPSDSTYNAQMTVEQYRARFQSFVTGLPQINIWETCNECNGDWLGPNASAQADAATDVVKAAGKKAFFTPYWNTSTCADKHGPYVAWIQKNISAAVKAESDYVMPSIYGSDCDGPEPTYAELDAMVQTFATMFPNAQVGIGEYGKQGSVTILQYYLGYNNSNPRYIFAGLYWYGAQDLIPKTKPMWPVFAGAFQ